MIKTIALDQEGYFVLENGVRLTEEFTGRQMLQAFQLDSYGVIHMSLQGEDYILECFDQPYVARQIHLEENCLFVQMPYQFKQEVDLNSLCLDHWDRFHGLTVSGIPFVLSRPAQAELLNSASAFTDDSITILGQTLSTPPYYLDSNPVREAQFWSERYQENPSPGWNLEKAHPELVSALPQLKLHKSRVLVPGCGYGHDAALLAEAGHKVTAVDVSEEALQGARQRYGHLENIQWLQADIFQLGDEYHGAFDMIFEHTCYCAIHPDDREKLFKVYRNYLVETGHLLGIFFVVPKRSGPYFGSSEWELQNQLEKRFRFLYWTRLKHSPDWRQGAELMIYAQLKGL
jgi:SAM-dependent methyltransferase